MSKKNDRKNTNYRNCPVCGRKTIFVNIFGRHFRKTVISCYSCGRLTKVKDLGENDILIFDNKLKYKEEI